MSRWARRTQPLDGVDYRDADQCKTALMPGVEFIDRFPLHVPPPRLRPIRRCCMCCRRGFGTFGHFGFLGPRVAAKKLELIRRLLDVKKPAAGDEPAEREATEDADQFAEEAPRRCRRCNEGQLVLVAEVPRPTVVELMRMPPSMEPVAGSGALQLHLSLSAFL